MKLIIIIGVIFLVVSIFDKQIRKLRNEIGISLKGDWVYKYMNEGTKKKFIFFERLLLFFVGILAIIYGIML